MPKTVTFKKWYAVSPAFSIRRKSANRYEIRREATGDVDAPKGPAANDALMMALYNDTVPVGYVLYAFGRGALV